MADDGGSRANAQLFSPRHNGPLPVGAMSMISPAVSRHKGLLGHAVTILQSPGYAMKALADGIDKVDRAMGASLNAPEANPGGLTKVLFKVNHPPSRPQVDDVQVTMHLLGSLKQLGSWEEMRAKTMKRCSEGGWEVVCYLGTDEEFEYQYILKDYDGQAVWRSSAERQQTVANVGGANTLEIIDFITKNEEETGNLYNQAAAAASTPFRALPPTPQDMGGDEEPEQPDPCPMQLPDRPADVDVGRDSTCALPRDSMLPPPTDENTKEMLRQSVTGSARGSILNFEDERPATAPSHAAFSDCQEWLTGPADSPCKGAVDVVKRAQRMETEEELEGETGDDAAQEVEAMQQRIEAAALTVANMTSYVLQQVGEGDADVSDVVHGSGLHEESEGADTPQDALSLALTELKSALEQRQCADAEARTRAQQQEQEQQEQRSEEQASLRAEQEKVARLQDEVKALQQQLLEAQEAQTQVGVKAQEVKDLQAALEEEKELAKMRSRRLRGGIRAVQGQLAGVRGGFDELRAQVKDMTDSILPDLSSMAGKLETSILGVAASIQTELDETNGKFEGEVKERKRLHNLVQELKGNIRVFARIRPISAREKEASRKSVALCTSDSEMSLCAGGKLSMYNFDRVFGQDSTQEEVFEETGPLVVSVLDGYNVCIFAYGQTGSGKTHTMEGSEAMRGVNYRSLSMLFQLAHDRRMIAKYEFKVSLLEIYNEQIKDLIELHDAKGDLKKLEVKNDPNGGTFVTDLKTSPVESIEDVLQVMSMGMRNRSTSSTNMNNQSSRSHCIFSVHVTCTDLLKGGTSFGKMHLVDLAGSERLSRTGAEGDRLTEAKNINKSLSALGNCISSLVSKSKHTPFRDSKLTHFLQDSLGGEAKMLMFVCASPCDADVQESKCSLEFATRVGTVELGSAKRRGDGGASAALKEVRARERGKEESAHRGSHAQHSPNALHARERGCTPSQNVEAHGALVSCVAQGSSSLRYCVRA